MDWTHITLIVGQKHSDVAASIAEMVSESGIYIEDYANLEQNVMEISHIDLIDQQLLEMDREHVKIHIYISPLENATKHIEYLKTLLKESNIEYSLYCDKIDEEDWANNWKKYYKPFNVGNKLMIKPQWETIDNSDGRTVLNIEPGLAFGTGTHESTKMCLELIEQCVTDGNRIMDIGCGSGILSVAAVLLGAEKAIAVDIDPLAVKITSENALLNGLLSNKIEVFEINLLENDMDIDAKCDIVVANIIADAIVALSAVVNKYLKKNGKFICSGIIDQKLEEVISALNSNGFVIEEQVFENGWVAITATYN